jgi:hypothetical protein
MERFSHIPQFRAIWIRDGGAVDRPTIDLAPLEVVHEGPEGCSLHRDVTGFGVLGVPKPDHVRAHGYLDTVEVAGAVAALTP